VDQAAQALVAERGAFRADQFKRRANFRAHYLHTGPELWEQSGGRIDAFCDFVGSGGTFAGCARALKERHPGIRCYVVEPEGAPVLAGKPVSQPHHLIQGGGYSLPDLPMIDRADIDGFLTVTDDEAIVCARRLAREEGIFAGFSSGANLAAALQLLNGPHPGATLAILICDSGLKYLSTELWE
jgi:cysteine synthase A